MEPFELKVDTNTIYIKIIRFIGASMLGFFIVTIAFKYKYEGTIDWMNSFTSIALSLAFTFYPGAAGKKSIVINEDGIFLKNYDWFLGKKEYSWSTVKAVEVKKDRIELTRNVGSPDKIKFPIHTVEQIENLKKYLEQLTGLKEVTFKQ